MAAEKGHSGGQANYGFCLYNCKGVRKNLAEAAKYFKLAADRGHAYGQNHYALCLEKGNGVAQDLLEAAKYYKMAMKQGYRGAEECFRRCAKRTKWGVPLNLNEYEKIKELGCGPCGVTQLMKHNLTEELIAVKCIPLTRGFDKGKLRRELAFFPSFRHRSFAGVAGWSLPNKSCSDIRIATEYLSRGSLEDVLELVDLGNPPGFWTHGNISGIIVGLIVGMRALHAQNRVHGDLKPSNLLLDDNHRVRISDFGNLAIGSCGASSSPDRGTKRYIAPEVLAGGAFTEKSDIFAFGLILYELLAGKKVSEDEEHSEVSGVGRESLPKIPSFVARPIAKLIERCWSDDPEKRPSFNEMYEYLEDIWFPFFKDVLPEVIEGFISELR
jgi:serine/threonine protein kinase